MFEHILKWKLRAGSHDFPGPDGGTCVNEAAIVAAGFKYRAIRCAEDCPRCFSWPIAAYAIVLNDTMHGRLRQKLLLPFVVRLAGTADTPEVERARASFMCLATFQRLISVASRRSFKRPDFAKQCRSATSPEEMIRFADSLKEFEEPHGDCDVALIARELARHVEEHQSSGDAVSAASYAAGAAIELFREEGHRVRRRVFTIATDILDEAIRLGKRPTIIPERAARRLNETMHKAPGLVEA